MKSISLASISSILAIFLITPASAAPLNVLEARASPSAADTLVTYISDASHHNDINPACFFSGQTLVERVLKGKTYTTKKSAGAELNAWRGTPRNIACHAIAEIAGKAKVQVSAFTNNDWKRVSKALAEHATGTAYLLLGQQVRANSVWETDEKPALKANKRVNMEIWEIDKSGSIVRSRKTKQTM